MSENAKKISFVIPCYRSENTIETVVDEIRTTMCAAAPGVSSSVIPASSSSVIPGSDPAATHLGTCSLVWLVPERGESQCIQIPASAGMTLTGNSHNSFDYEIILVCDSSPDNVWQVIKKLAADDPKIKGICLAKNFGQHCALMAGYANATGDYIVSLDDDGQTPASDTFKLVDKLEEGFDVVYGYYEHAAQHLFRRFGSWVNKKMAEAIIGQPKTLKTTSFFIMRKFIADEIVRYPHPFAYISGLVFRATKNLGNVAVGHRHRIEGKSGYTLAGLISLWANGFTAFSVKPLRAATYIGILCALVGFIGGLFVIWQKFTHPAVPIGYTSLLATMLFIGGMIMLLLGLIGEYVGRIYISINQSPQYVIRERT